MASSKAPRSKAGGFSPNLILVGSCAIETILFLTDSKHIWASSLMRLKAASLALTIPSFACTEMARYDSLRLFSGRQRMSLSFVGPLRELSKDSGVFTPKIPTTYEYQFHR